MCGLIVWRTNLHEIFPDFLRLVWISLDASLGARAEHDEREGELSAIIVGNTDDADVRDVGMVEEMTLELRRRHLESAHFDELLDAIYDEDFPVFV